MRPTAYVTILIASNENPLRPSRLHLAVPEPPSCSDPITKRVNDHDCFFPTLQMYPEAMLPAPIYKDRPSPL